MQTTVTTLAGQAATISRPTQTSVGRLIVMIHGSGLTYDFATGNPADPANAFYTRIQGLIDYLTFGLRGYTVVCCALLDTSLPAAGQGDHAGNTAATTQLASVIAAAKALPNISQGKYGLIGFSAGSFLQANHYRLVGASPLAGLLSICPAGSQSWLRGTDANFHTPTLPFPQGSAYAAYNLAYGVGGANGNSVDCDAAFAAAEATHEPSAIAPSVTIPWGFWTHSNDPLSPPSEAHKVATLVPNGKGTEYNMGATDLAVNLGHNTLHVEPNDVLNFLETWSW